MKKLTVLSVLVIIFALTLGLSSCGDVAFNVNFIVDGEIYGSVSTKGNETIEIPENPVKEDLVFDGWYWDKDVWEKPFTANSLLDAPLSSDMSVYAKWKEKEHIHTLVTDSRVEPTDTEDGLTEGSHCSECGAVITVQEKIPALIQGAAIKSAALTVDGDRITGVFSNATEVFSFINDIKVAKGASYVVARDIYCENLINSKTVPLETGDNSFYLLVTNGNDMKLYTVTLRRRPMYTVSFDTKGGSTVANQTVEEGNLATVPQNPVYLGFVFDGWDRDFSEPITENTNVQAKYSNNPIMEPFEFTSNGNTCIITGVKDKNLESIIIPDCVTSIGKRAFSSCDNLVSITIPNSVTSLGSYAFEYCTSLTSVTIPNSVTSIGGCAFEYCTSLESITIPNSVTSIGLYAFAYCDRLASVSIGNGVTSIGSDAFAYCISLKSITVDEYNKAYKSIDGNLYTKDGTTFIKYAIAKNDTSFTIPEGVTSIGSYAFYNCTSLTSITIPNSVTSIGNSAFRNCTSLIIYCEAASKPTGWDSDWNYSNCPVVWDYKNNDIASDGYIYVIVGGVRYALKDGVAEVAAQPKSIKIANIASSITYKGAVYNVTSIGNSAFRDCQSLTSVTIPNSVTSIGYSAFYGCDSLTIYCEAASQPSEWSSSWNSLNCPVVWDYKNNDIASDGYIYVIVDGVRYALKDGVATVVRQSESIKIANIASSITYKGAVYNVTSIGSYAFLGCTSLESVTIPNSVTSIGSDAFAYCISLKSITVDEYNKAYKSIDGNLYTKDGTTFIKYAIGKTDKSFEIPNGVTSIGSCAFRGCQSLTSVTIGNGVTSIGDSAFYNCTSLESITIPSSVTSIGDSTFYHCISLESITVPSSVTSIGDSAFEYCHSLESITIPNSVASIGGRAFYYCDSLTIYCEAASQPSGWSSSWKSSNCPVVWNYKKS